MKGLRLLLAVCLAPLTFWGAMADNNTDAARAAVRRTTNNTVTSARQKSSDTASKESATNTTSVSRTTNLSVKPGTSPNERGHTGASPRSDTSVTTSSTGTRSKSVTTRQPTATPVRTRTASIPTASRTAATGQSRSTTSRTATTTPRVINTARTASSRAALSRSATKTIARATNTDSVAAARAEIMSHNAKNCREVYYNCMDEFCANKDAQLKRCACSSRLHEFDSVKKNLENVEDKMLSFNQRLLTVNMDKEDAEALYKATEGELAFNQKDTSQSKKMLDEIAKKLNTSFDDSNFDRNLSPISLSLNADSAFDSLDSMQGASATSKTGTELYTAALPICREMAREVCTDDDLSIAESGYQMVIEQDCNTVAKSYQAQTDQARERVREGSALLDMSRLDIYQKRNSDDTLTCKKKMLDMLTDSSVCGSDMGKCLDVSGKYIDPSTGAAFLTTDLVQINNLITRPSGDQTWTSAPGNSVFISYLNSKKKFLAPAMENCQDIADTVWDAFLDDALAQIKLAQENKLEDMRQSCTALTTKCMSDTAKSLSDFDARALSIFGVKADKTVKAMCTDVTNACSALLQNQSNGTVDKDWVNGMTEIANMNTYETILSTCREVGRACIIQVCSSISGNFGLCESIQSSVNRKSIINRTACWNEVVQCVKDAGTDTINEIMVQLNKGELVLNRKDLFMEEQPVRPIDKPFPGQVGDITPARSARNARSGTGNLQTNNNGQIQQGPVIVPGETQQSYFLAVTGNDFYNETYNAPSERADNEPQTDKLFVAKRNRTGCTASNIENNSSNITCLYDICDECNIEGANNLTDAQKTNCNACRIAEQIWGNCEAAPATQLNAPGMHNKILQPKDGKTTLLWWFAQNTGTSTATDSCRDTTCPPGYTTTHTSTPDGVPDILTCSTDGFDITLEVCPNRYTYNVKDDILNCCPVNWNDSTKIDEFGNCPAAETIQDVELGAANFKGDPSISETFKMLYLPKNYAVVATWTLTENADIKNSKTNKVTATYPAGDYVLICAGAESTGGDEVTDTYPAGQTITCNGTFVAVNLTTGLYFTPGAPDTKTNYVKAIDSADTECYYSLTPQRTPQGTSQGWKQTKDGTTTNCDLTPEHWKINIDYEP